MGFNPLQLICNAGQKGACDALFNAAKRTLRKNLGRDRITVTAEQLEQMPDFVKRLASGLENPTVMIGRNSSKNSSVWGIAVRDGEKPVAEYALALDTTAEKCARKPIYQYRRRLFLGDKKVYAATEKIDTARTVSQESDIVTTTTKRNGTTSYCSEVDGTFAQSGYYDEKGIQELNKRGLKLPDHNEVAQTIDESVNDIKINERINNLRKFTTSRISFGERLASMGLEEIEGNIQKYLAKSKKLEKELDELYLQALGKDAELALKDEEFAFGRYVADGIIPKVNPQTGEPIPAKLIEKIMTKRKQYVESKLNLVSLNLYKKLKGGYGNAIPDESYLQSLMQKFGIKPHPLSKKVTAELRALRGLPKEEIMTKAKDIFAREYKLPADLIKVRPTTEKEAEILGSGAMCFFNEECCILFNPQILEILNDEHIIALLGHEMRHAKDSITFAKAVGLDTFYSFFSKKINKHAWTRVLKRIEPTQFDTNMCKAMIDYNILSQDFYKNLNYYGNLQERLAYQRGFDIHYSLSETKNLSEVFSIFEVIMTKFATAIKSKLAKIGQLKGKDFKEAKYFEELQKRATLREKNLIGTNSDLSLQETMIKILDEDIKMLSKKA